MKTTVLLAAAALASLLAGCEDDQALGTERSRQVPEAPAPIDFPPDRPRDTEGTPSAETVEPAMPSESASERTRAADREVVPAPVAPPAVMNGEDLAQIPDLTEPIWATARGSDTMQRSPQGRELGPPLP
jgi:hypothetical protein